MADRAESPSAQTAGPVGSQDRIHTLDILRGFALFGMIVVHFHQHVHNPATGLEGLIGWIVWIGFETKAWGTFAFLFGVGFAILLRRVEAKGLRFVIVYLRRLVVLALFGIVAEALFGFKVLLGYAIWGVPLLFLRRFSTPLLCAIAALAVAANPLLSAGAALHIWPSLTSEMSQVHARLLAAAIDAANQHGSFVEIVAARLQGMRYSYLRLVTLVPDSTLTLFILGLLAVRHRFVDEPRKHVRAIAAWMMFGAAAWATSWLILYRIPELEVPALTWEMRFGFGLVQDQWLCFTFIGGLTLWLAYRSVWLRRLAPFGWAGRMALTNYMLQIALLDYLVSGYGLALRLRPAFGILAAALLFGVEVAISRVWLTRYRFGPLEWVWRSLTYGRWQPMRRAGEMADPAMAV
jgi:uncharacterized protein